MGNKTEICYTVKITVCLRMMRTENAFDSIDDSAMIMKDAVRFYSKRFVHDMKLLYGPYFLNRRTADE